MKETNQIVKYCLMLFVVAGLCFMHYKDLISNGMFCVWAIFFVIIIIMDIVKRRKSAKRGQEQASKALGNPDDAESHVSHTVNVRPTLAGMCCDLFTIIMLMIAWILIIRKDLLDLDSSHAIYIYILYTMGAVVSLVANYQPRTYGGMYQLYGMKQVKQDIIRLHAVAFVCALTVLICSLRYILTSNTGITVLMGISAVGVVVIFVWKFFIKKVTPTQEDIEKVLKDE